MPRRMEDRHPAVAEGQFHPVSEEPVRSRGIVGRRPYMVATSAARERNGRVTFMDQQFRPGGLLQQPVGADMVEMAMGVDDFFDPQAPFRNLRRGSVPRRPPDRPPPRRRSASQPSMKQLTPSWPTTMISKIMIPPVIWSSDGFPLSAAKRIVLEHRSRLFPGARGDVIAEAVVPGRLRLPAATGPAAGCSGSGPRRRARSSLSRQFSR